MTERGPFQQERNKIAQWEKHVRALVDWSEPIDGCDPAPGPLSGWSVAVKDIIDVEGLPTRCNAPFPASRPAAASAGVVAALRTLGGLVIAKTVTTTFAYYDPGPTRNPWNLAHTPGGSSSGSAAAVACGMARLALGSQTIGSINRPASFCGVVGFKPTHGRLPMNGVFPVAPTVDTVGFFTQTATDARTAFTALAGRIDAGRHGERLRVGVIEDLLCAPETGPMRDAVRDAADRLSDAGNAVRSLELDSTLRDSYANHHSLVASEAAQSHASLAARYADQYPKRLWELIETGRGVPRGELQRIAAHRGETRAIMAEMFEGVDVLLSPSAPGAAPQGIAATGDPRMNLLWSYMGLPTVTLPVAVDARGLPLGVQLTGAFGRDEELLDAAVAVSGSALAFGHRPRLSPLS